MVALLWLLGEISVRDKLPTLDNDIVRGDSPSQPMLQSGVPAALMVRGQSSDFIIVFKSKNTAQENDTKGGLMT